MKRISIKVKGLLLSMFIFQFAICQAQKDSVLHRSVTVERDFQPVIQAAGKVATRPAVVETTFEPAKAEYSTYTTELTPGAETTSLLSQPTRFEAGKAYNGYIRGGLGHPNTLFDFGYHLDDGKKSILDVYAHHRAEWGLAALSKTKLGLDFKHPFSTCDLYFGLNGGNVFYHKYGHFYYYSLINPGMWEKNSVTYPKPRVITALDKTSLWTGEVYLGVKSNPKQEVQYKVQTGYALFAKIGAVSEHQIRTHASFDWHREAHHVGANFHMQNNILQLRGNLAATIPDSMVHNCHDIRLEPYYAYEGRRFRIHLGVNIDLNIGNAQNSLSGVKNLCFAPSPHIYMEAQVAKQWLTLYMDIRGNHNSGSLQEFMEENRYRLIHAGILDHHFAAYTPVDGELGLRIRPYRDLFIELHGGYAYMLNQTVLKANTTAAPYLPLPGVAFLAGDFDYFYADYTRGKIGGQLNYHYRDIVRINLHGDCYFWNGDIKVYDRARWNLGLRVDGRIDEHWSLYSENRFEGSRIALATDGEHTLRPIIELDLGVRYAVLGRKPQREQSQYIRESGEQVLRPEPQPNLVFFFQLNNWLHRKNEFYYGYRSQGINFLTGVTFRF